MSQTLLSRKIAFSRIKGLKPETAAAILEKTGGVDGFFDSSTRLLWDKIGSQKGFCTDNSRDALIEAGRKEAEFVESTHAHALFFEDEEYPHRLLECEDAPLMAYCLGNCDLNAKHIVSVVGTRRATAYGIRFARDLVCELAERLDSLIIVSGLAYGIDVAAHKAALECGIPTVAVVAHGLKTIYPADHRDVAARIIKNGGAILTEYISTDPVHRGNFLARNRIVAGLADCTIIVESEEKGGAMSTAATAAAYNREVMAVPGRATDRFSAGPNRLIHTNCASLIRNSDDLISLMNWQNEAKTAVAPTLDFIGPMEKLDGEQKKIVDYLRTKGNATADELTRELGIPYPRLSSMMMQLEMDDIVAALPGQAFTLTI